MSAIPSTKTRLTMDSPKSLNEANPGEATKTLQIYSRLAFGRKFLFAPSPSAPAQYFIVNPVPHKHHHTWKPVFFRGDNPKYTPGSKAIARMRRTKMWNSFRVQFGDGVGEALENKKRVKKTRRYRRGQRWRKRFGMRATEPKEGLEDARDVRGLVMEFGMKRRAFVNRTVRWEFGGEEYRWTGTRMFRSSTTKRWKGVSHDLKVCSPSSH